MEEFNCASCNIPMGKSPHVGSNSFERIGLFCFNCANLRERGIE